jgi:hypothetical protein
MNSFPNAADFNARRVTNPSQSEVIRQRLYDYQLYPTAGVTQLTFFQNPVGQGVTSAVGNAVGTAKTLWDTNMSLPGQLASGLAFMVESIEVLFIAGQTATGFIPFDQAFYTGGSGAPTNFNGATDTNRFYNAGLLELNILSKNYLRETPALAFPPKANFDLSASNAIAGGTQVAGAALLKAGGRPYFVEPSIALQPAVNFEVVLRYPAAVATPSGFNGRVGIILDGYTMRASQ